MDGLNDALQRVKKIIGGSKIITSYTVKNGFLHAMTSPKASSKRGDSIPASVCVIVKL